MAFREKIFANSTSWRITKKGKALNIVSKTHGRYKIRLKKNNNFSSDADLSAVAELYIDTVVKNGKSFKRFLNLFKRSQKNDRL
jgi:hypothetical protein